MPYTTSFYQVSSNMLCWNINYLMCIKRIRAEIYLLHVVWVSEINSYVQI